MKKLIAGSFRNDPRLQEAKRLLKQALYDYQKALTNSCPADSDLKKDYDKLIQRFSEIRAGDLFFPYLASGIGKGALVELADGSVKYDFITGIGVHYFGHNHPRMMEAAIDAALEDTFMQGNLQQSMACVELAELLIEAACRRQALLTHCFFSSSGAMANENALKIIFQKKYPAHRLLAFKNCFAGRSLVMAQITDKPENREGLPKVLEVDYIPFFDPEKPQESIQEALRVLKSYLQQYPGQHAGMMFELIQGEGGYYPGSREFFVSLMDILKENQIAVFIDEIQTFGRTEEAFAFQYFGLDQYADVVSVGKPLLVCATLFTDEYRPRAGLLSQTFTASTSSVYAAKVMLSSLLREGYLGKEGKIIQFSGYFVNKLKEISLKYPQLLRGPFGFGAMVACTVFDGSAQKSKIFLQKLFEAGVMAFVAGKSPVRVRFLLPIGAVRLEDIDTASRIIEETLIKVNTEI